MALLSTYLSRARNAAVLDYIHGDVLDIGCQQGHLRERAAAQIDRYVGIDISEPDIAEARRRHPDCEFEVLNLDDQPLGYEQAFDTIVILAVIEHIFNLKHFGESLSRALKPGGSIVLTTPTPFGNDIVHRLGSAVGLFSQVAADDHIVIFNRKRLEIFANEVGLVLARHQRFQLGCNQLAILSRSI